MGVIQSRYHARLQEDQIEEVLWSGEHQGHPVSLLRIRDNVGRPALLLRAEGHAAGSLIAGRPETWFGESDDLTAPGGIATIVWTDEATS